MTYLEEKSFVHSLEVRRSSLKKRGLEETSEQARERLDATESLRKRTMKIRSIMKESRKQTYTCESIAPVVKETPKKDSLFLVMYKSLYLTKAWILAAKSVEDACVTLCVLKPQYKIKQSLLTAREYCLENLELNAERI